MHAALLDEFNLLQNLHPSTQNCVCTTSFRPFGEVSGNSSKNLTAEVCFGVVFS